MTPSGSRLILAAALCLLSFRSLRAQDEHVFAVQETSEVQSFIGTSAYTCAGPVLHQARDENLWDLTGPVAPRAPQEKLIVRKIAVAHDDRFGPSHPGFAVRVLFTAPDGEVVWDSFIAAPFPSRAQLASGGIASLLGSLHDNQVRAPDKGSSLSDVECILGQPEEANDYGDETQYTYDDGTLLFYVSNDTGLVTTVQTLTDNRNP
ncbi:MAG: hypothetical protein ACYCPM_02045 [Acidobacteriaceae bacterium]